ncbi:MAG: TolC family protein [Paracoccus sp. (in: a-proteobacteria)]
MEMVFHLGVHCTDGDRLLKTLLNNREWLLGKGTEIVTPQRHRGLFEEALMALNGGRATPEMEQIMLDAMLTAEAPRRVVLSTPTFMGAPGRVCGRNEGLYPQMGSRAAALASLFPQAQAEFFLAIRNPATLLSEVLPIFTGGALRGNLAAARYDREAAQARYEGTIQTAFREVADALAVRATIDERLAASERQAQAAADVFALAEDRFEAGIPDYSPVLAAQREAYTARRALVAARLAEATNTVAVYRTLGGALDAPARTGDAPAPMAVSSLR